MPEGVPRGRISATTGGEYVARSRVTTIYAILGIGVVLTFRGHGIWP
jgi:hypothetical protein